MSIKKELEKLRKEQEQLENEIKKEIYIYEHRNRICRKAVKGIQ